jgi:heptosyltransferase I
LTEAGSIGKPVIGFVVGASTANKAWPAERWSEAADLLNRQGASIVLLGSSAEVETAHAIRIAPGGAAQIISLVGKTPLPVLASVLAQCDVVIGGDSGPTHLAVAVGTPVVGLYGVTDPVRTGPQWGSARAIVLDYAETESPAETRRPRHNKLPDALARIPAEAVASAAMSLLDSRARQ